MAQVVSSEHTTSYALARDCLLSYRDLGVTDLIIDLLPEPSEYPLLGRLIEELDDATTV